MTTEFTYNKSYPFKFGEHFLGLYDDANPGKVEGRYCRIIWKANHPEGPFRFLSLHNSQHPHYVHDPIAWAPLPRVHELKPLPIERAVASIAKDYLVPPDMMRRVELQGREFDALEALKQAFVSLPAIVDDDYPRCRHIYDTCVSAFLRACADNGRMEMLGYRKS